MSDADKIIVSNAEVVVWLKKLVKVIEENTQAFNILKQLMEKKGGKI